MIIPIKNVDDWYLYQHQQHQENQKEHQRQEESFQDILDKLLGKEESLCQ